MGLEAAALFDPLFVYGEFDAVEPVVECGVRSRPGSEQEMAANRLDGLANRLAGIEIVADIDRFQPRQAGPVGGQPAPPRPALAVLLLLPVLGNDDLRGQRYRPGMTRGNQCGRHHVVVILHGPIAALAPRAVGAGDLPRAEVFGAVERDQKVAVQASEGTQPTTRLQAFQQRSEERIEPVRRHRIQHRADLVVRRDPRHGEQGLAVRTLPRARKRTLMGQERRALHEEKRERRKPEVGHLIADIASRPLVRQRRADRTQFRYNAVEHIHPHLESETTARV